jgi:SNF2 family DNA or RNA helicase
MDAWLPATPQPFKPHGYQRQAIQFGVAQGAAGFFLDPGLGKTSIMLAIFKILRDKGYVKKMLVIAPLRPAYSVWPGEMAKWAEFNDLKWSILHGPEKATRLKDDSDIHIINPEGLSWLFEQKYHPWQMLVVDESTRFKHSNTQRFKLLKPQLGKFPRRYILTGSPAPNGLMDLFGQVYILDGGASLGRYITHFRSEFFNPTGYQGYDWVIKNGAEKKIYSRLKPLVMRLAAKDYLELPPLIYNNVSVTLPGHARGIYEEMEKELVASLADETVFATNAAAATTKCRQIANGGIYHEGGEKWSDIHEAKVEAVAELVEELSGKPALIAYEYAHDLQRLLAKFGSSTPYIGGGVPASRFAAIERAWNAGNIPVLLAQPQSVAHGLNLQGTGAAVIWHSLTWNLEDYEQFIRRVWRQGQKERVVVHHIVAKDTIDEAVMAAIALKDRTQQHLLTALKTYIKGGKRGTRGGDRAAVQGGAVLPVHPVRAGRVA